MRFSIDADPRYGAFTLRTECPRCGAHLPANGPVPEVDCSDCGARVAVPAGLVRSIVEQFEARWPTVRASDTVTLGDLTWRWTSAEAGGPCCASCAEVLADEDVEELACACGAWTTAAPAPNTLRDHVPSARRVFAADAEAPTGLEPESVALACPQCGAGLSVTGDWQRLSPCSHCGVTVPLPENVWRQLHPPRTVRSWTVRFDGEGPGARRARIAAEEQAGERRAAEEKAERKRLAQQEAQARREQQAAADRAIQEQEAVETAEADRRWRLTTIPLVVISWLAMPFAFGGLIAATAWYMLGTPNVLMGRVAPGVLAAAPRFVVLGALAAAAVGWAISFWAAARSTRQSLLSLLPVGFLHVGLSVLPLFGWPFGIYFTLRHMAGLEPLLEAGSKPVPWSARFPLAAYLVAFSLYTYVATAAVLNMPVPMMWYRFFHGMR